MGWDDNSLNVVRRVSVNYGVTCRPDAPLRRRVRAAGAEGQAEAPDQPAELRRALRAADDRAREEVLRPLDERRPQRRLVAESYTTIGGRAHDGQPAGVPRPPRSRPRLHRRGADGLGRRVPDGRRPGRARGPRDARRLPPPGVPSGRRRGRHPHRDHPARAGPGVRGPRRPPERRAVQAAVRHRGHTPLFGVARPDPAAPPRRSREGIGHRHDLHVRRHHRRHVVARARPSRPQRRRARRHAAGRSRGARRAGTSEDPAAAQAEYDELRRQVDEAGAEADRRAAPRQSASSSAIRSRSPIRSSSGRTAHGRSRSSPTASGSSAAAVATPSCASALVERGKEIAWHPEYMRVRYENWVNGLTGDWNITRQLPFGVPIPLWYPIGDDGEVDWEHAAAAGGRAAADRPVGPRPAGLHRGPARPARRLHRRPERHGHLGDVLAVARRSSAAGATTPSCSRRSSPTTCARRPTTSSGRGSSTPCSAPTSSTTSSRGSTSPSPASSSTPTARSCRSRRATRPRTPTR